MRKPIQLSPLRPAPIAELHAWYRPTTAVRLRTRAPSILLAADPGMSAPTIAQRVREHDQTVRHWLTRDRAEGLEGLPEAPALGRSEASATCLCAPTAPRGPVAPAESGRTLFALDSGPLG